MQKEKILELRATIQQFIRSFGLLEQTKTPCGFSMSLSQVFALQELKFGTLTVTELADRLQLDRSSVSRLIDGLVNGGFVSRKININNRREVLLALTDKGVSTIQRIQEQSVDYYRIILEKMTEFEQDQLYNSFKIFTHSIAEVQKEKNSSY